MKIYGINYPHTGVNCNLCGELYLWGLSWDGSKEGKFICDKCKNKPYCRKCGEEITLKSEEDIPEEVVKGKEGTICSNCV